MVRGVNRYVIEINNAENKFFDRVIFFVKPECDGVNSEKLKTECRNIVDKTLFEDGKTINSCNKMHENKIKITSFISGVVLSSVVFIIKSIFFG